MDRSKLQRLAILRRDDAEELLARSRWAAAYYLTGYAVECGLKACLLKHLGESDAVFGGDGKYLKELASCWTHDLTKLKNLAGLDGPLGLACKANPTLKANWDTAQLWKETSRYEERAEAEALALYEAVARDPDGVLVWIQSRW